MIIYVYNRCSFNNGCRFGFRRCLAAFRQFIQQAGKFQLPEKFNDFAPVKETGPGCLHDECHRGVGYNRGQDFALAGNFGVFPQ